MIQQNLNYYHTFYTVATTGSISKAASLLYISQPAISKTIAHLEKNLGCTLFHRTPRGVRLTEEGIILKQRLDDAFASISAGEEELSHRLELGISEIKIGVSTTLCKYMLLPYLQSFIAEHPHIKITIACQSSLHTLQLLEQQKIDIGLIGNPGAHSSVIFTPLSSIQDTFVATSAYLSNLSIRNPNALLDSQADFDFDVNSWHQTKFLLSESNLMLLDEQNITRQYINEYFIRNHIEIKQILEVSTMDLLIEFARIGLGIACVIREFVLDDLASGRLVELPLQEPIEKRNVGFAYSKSHHPSDTVVQFLRHCQVLPDSDIL